MYKFLILFLFYLLPALLGRELLCQGWEYSALKELHIQRNTGLDPLANRLSQSTYLLAFAVPIGTTAIGYARSDSALTWKGVSFLAGSAFSVGSTLALKELIRRPRPFREHPDIRPPFDRESGYAFPSGHTAAAFTTAMELSLLHRRWFVVAPAFVWAGSVGWSRLHLGQHYPGDVLAGALTGTASAWLGWKLNRWIQSKPRIKRLH